jgi:fused signal recognition particle receptor
MFRKLILNCIFLTYCVLVLGAYVRLADTGAGCPEWPGCLGRTVVEGTPLEATGNILDQAGFGFSQSWPEVAHAYLASVLGLLVLIPFLMSFWLQERRWSTMLLTLAAVLLVDLQAAVGIWGGKLLLHPSVVVAEIIAGLLTLGLLAWAATLQHPPADNPVNPAGRVGLRWLARAGLLALLLQIALGSWVSVNDAALACPDFPTCLGSFNPPVDYAAAFPLPGALSVDGELPRLSISAKAAVHWLHRLGAVLVFVLLTVLALKISLNRQAGKHLSRSALLLNLLLLLQIGLGIGAVLLRLPLAATVAHNVVATLLFLTLLHILFLLRGQVSLPTPAAQKLRPETLLVTTDAAFEGWRESPATRAPVPAAVVAPPLQVEPPRREPPIADNLFGLLKSGLGKTRGGLTGFLANLALGKKSIDRDLLEDIEAQLLMADIGVAATTEIIKDLTNSLERSQLANVDALTARLREHLYELIEPVSRPLQIAAEHKPFVILVVGVNGVGKTTTIGKLANRLKLQGHSVMLAAGDTFRAAAVEQLQTWGERNDIQVISQGSGADSASVIFDGVKAAQARGIDVLIADTAGRLHTKSNLMEELTKIKRIMGKLDPAAPHEVLLVLDGGTGQNAINQTKQFNEAVSLTGLAVTKLDGTAKGGVVFALAKQFGIPIRYIGVGETIDDLQDFDARKFIEALFAE